MLISSLVALNDDQLESHLRLFWLSLALILASFFFALLFRAFTISKNERRTGGMLWQTLLFFRREVILIRRGWTALAFHLAQLVFGGLFIGLLYYGHPYKGPLIQLNTTICPDNILSKGYRLVNAACTFLSYPEDDVIMPLASLNSLTMALCAIGTQCNLVFPSAFCLICNDVAYAIPVFGSEVAVFQRESMVGVSTSAYYLGKTAAHLLVSALAPLVYLLSISALAPLSAPFWQHYAILVVTHLTFSGAGYTLSLVVTPALAHLLGVFYVLSNMMFSGYPYPFLSSK